MDVINTRNFGLLIAYVLPGFVCLLGAGTLSDAVWVWLVGAGSAGPSVGGAFYVGLASIGAGMTASVVRWAVLDTAHHFTGLQRPSLDESRLTERLAAFNYLVEQHYRYYQFYGNTLVATLLAFAMWRVSEHADLMPAGWPEACLAFIVAVFAAGSRDALRKYYSGGVLLLGTVPKRRRRRMTNGKHPAPTSNQSTAAAKSVTKSQAIRNHAGTSQTVTGHAGKGNRKA